jgi:hypothetical protein
MAMVLEQADEAAFRLENQVDDNVVRTPWMDNLLAEDNRLLAIFARLREAARQQAGESGRVRSCGGSMAS